MNKKTRLVFVDGNKLTPIFTQILFLKKLNNIEFAFTSCEKQIPVVDIVEIEGVKFTN
jgi:prophage maintenance system killer protein